MPFLKYKILFYSKEYVIIYYRNRYYILLKTMFYIEDNDIFSYLLATKSFVLNLGW